MPGPAHPGTRPAALAPGLVPEMVAAVTRLLRGQDLVLVARAAVILLGERRGLSGVALEGEREPVGAG